MRKLIVASGLGLVLGLIAGLARSPEAAAAKNGTPCGPITCAGNQECCVSPGPTTYSCVKPGGCRFN